MVFGSAVGEANYQEKLNTCLPGNMPPLRPSDLNAVYRAKDPSDVFFNAAFYESQKQNKGDYVLVNTFEDLVGRDTVEALSLNGCPALAIGPLFLPNFLQGVDPATSLLEEDESCLPWLDMQRPSSVIYVSFRSLAVKSQEQLEQLALGLEGSGKPAVALFTNIYTSYPMTSHMILPHIEYFILFISFHFPRLYAWNP